MKCRFLVILLASLFCLEGKTGAAAPQSDAQQISTAIEKAKTYLYSLQDKNGTWEDKPLEVTHGPASMAGAYTTLVTYALLATGENPNDPKLARAIEFVKKADLKLTYAVGIRDQILLMLPRSPEVIQLANKDARMLLSGADQFARFGYDAGKVTTNNVAWRAHNSTSQYGVLGLWACEQLGAEIPTEFWRIADAGWIDCQGSDGAWAYYPSKPVAVGGEKVTAQPSMTAAGVATLFITRNYLHRDAESHGNIESPEIDLALKWLGDHFAMIHDAYTWYGIERIGVAGGYKYIGTHDWYEEGSQTIMRSQAPTGQIGGRNWGGMVETSLALVFLVRGRAPVAINKLRYNVTAAGRIVQGHWNQRPRDCFNFVDWMKQKTETWLNWQIVDLANDTAADLNDAPVLFITGNQSLEFSETERDKLRSFVLHGGLIVGNADEGSQRFSTAFKELGKELFPAYDFRDLPPDHPIFANEQFPASKWKTKPIMAGLSNGVREFMILPQTDISRSFQAQNILSQVESYQLLDDIILYASDQTALREKSSTYLLATDQTIPIQRTIKIARVIHEGNSDPEPYGWNQLAALLHNNFKIALTVEPVKLGVGALLGQPAANAPPPLTAKELRDQAVKQIPPDQIVAAAADSAKLESLIRAKVSQLQAAEKTREQSSVSYAIADITGTGSFSLNDSQRKELLEFVDKGGTLIVDSAGGGSEFGASAERELIALFGDAARKGLTDYLPPEDPIFQQNDAKIVSFAWRRFARKVVGITKDPRIAAIRRNGRIVAFYSREDLSAGLVGEPVDGVVGYEPATATAIMRNIILYATAK